VKNNPQHKNKKTNMIIETLQLKSTESGEICIVTRHYEEAKNDFLQWQVGVYESRPIEDPIYGLMTHPDGSPVVSEDGAQLFRLLGHEVNPAVCCKVFHLLGFGANLKKARAMAAEKLPAVK
jgi:hypothetical protein